MPRHEPRVKTYLMRAITQWLRSAKPETFSLTDDFKLEVAGSGTNWIMLRVTDPAHNMPTYYEVRITEKL